MRHTKTRAEQRERKHRARMRVHGARTRALVQLIVTKAKKETRVR